MTSIDIQVDDIPLTRDVTLTLTQEEAEKVLRWMDNPNSVGKPYSMSLLRGAVSAIAQQRNYGGN